MPNVHPFPQFQFDSSFDIPGLKREASAITFNPTTDTLLVVADEPAAIVEFTTEGALLRKVKLKGFKDTEGLCHLAGHQYAVAEERRKRITVIDLPPGQKRIKGGGARIDLDIKTVRNKGLEGVSYDAQTDTLYVAREGKPVTVFRLHPFLGRGKPKVKALALDLSALRDLSDLYFDPTGPWLWALSDESRAILVFNMHAERIAEFSLEKGSLGLPESIPQAEGITRDSLGRLYVCTEPDTVYRFKPKPVSA